MLQADPSPARRPELRRVAASASASPLFADVRQICTVTRDFERTVQNLVDHLGVGPFRVWHFRAPRLHGTTYRGRPATYSMKLAITWHDDVQWEVITPTSGPTLYGDHLDAHGPGVQHLLMGTGAIPFEAAAETLARRGHPFGQTARVNAKARILGVPLPSVPNVLSRPLNLQFGYVDAEATLRTSIELTRYPLGLSERFSLRSAVPESCVPARNSRFETALPTRRIGRLVKITIVTRNLDATVGSWIDLASVGPWGVFSVNEGLRARVAWAMIGDNLIEIVEPESEAGPLADVLRTRGEGVASVGVLPGPSGFDALVDRCTGLGYALRMKGGLHGEHRSVYLGARPFLGTDLEVVAPAGGTFAAAFSASRPERTLG